MLTTTRPITPEITVSVLRIVMGLILVTEGTGKLFGWFHGAGLEVTRDIYDRVGVPLSPHHAVIIGALEAVAGALLVAGLATRFAALTVAAMTVGATYILWSINGHVSNTQVMALAIYLALVQLGAGPLSIDARICADAKT